LPVIGGSVTIAGIPFLPTGLQAMCELLGMNANVPTDICFSFSGLASRGGRTGPHTDGWGIAF
jgi:hypothetical protein